MFEYENNLLIVDELIYDPGLPNTFVVRINDKHYMIIHSVLKRPIPEDAIRSYKKSAYSGWHRAIFDHEFYFAGLIPRGGFQVPLGRPITAEELKELCDRYGLTEEEVSKEFDEKIGQLYGNYSKDIKSIQIKAPPEEAISLEEELREKGIQAFNGYPGRVNIRTDWGEYREGAGRKPTGRRMVRLYVTEEEEQKLREYLKELREK